MGLTKNDINLRIGAFGAEPWTESMRKEIEERLGLKGYNIYGLSEIMGPGVSYECQEQHGSHINEDHFILKSLILKRWNVFRMEKWENWCLLP